MEQRFRYWSGSYSRSIEPGILTALPSAAQTALVSSDVLVALEQLHMKAKFLPISEQHYQDWVEQQGSPDIL